MATGPLKKASVCLAMAALIPAINAQANTWKGEAELGFVSTSGNTETTNVNLKAGAVNQRNQWKHSLNIESINSSNDAGTTAERYLLWGKSDYSLSERSYLFGLVKWEKDRFLGYDYQLSEVLGYGRHILQEEPLTLDLEIGTGARQTELKTGDSDNELIGWLAGDLHWQISETTKLNEYLTIEIGDNTITRSVTSLTTKINTALAMKVSLTAKNTSKVPVGKNKTDTETAVTLVYSF